MAARPAPPLPAGIPPPSRRAPRGAGCGGADSRRLRSGRGTKMAAEADSWDADSFEVVEPVAKRLVPGVAAGDRWAGEDEEDDVKDNWDDEEEEEEAKETEIKQEPKVSEKKKIAEKIKEKEKQQKKKQEELKKRLEAPEEHRELTPEEQLADKLRLKKLQEESDLELAKETFGVNNTCGIDAMNPSSKDDFTEFGKLLKEKITQYEKSLHYASFLEALVRDVCISLEIDDLKKITNSLTVLCSEKQKQEKQSKAKKKKKGVVPGGGLKATMKDDLADYGGYDGEYVQDFEDFM
ncbi:eukaryotic translation initiation factor 3 subunit J [Anas platyrhynchos]|uniref:Eukaryotic translation initiation factor 3 subunit J n=2 Tax=Anas TaxID=8835 RepID=U3ILM1_ANAPP|nr:eukaryotic translation initiation factor 3 subunit J [Anas platyrhynchos]|eukprot:XP_027321428.1 eukaryotic translation initiation factor 3 subunit J [Anas platyrhynchos]